jgi:hypothetical protein
MIAELDANHKRMTAKMKAHHEERVAIMRADQGETKTYPEKGKAIPGEMESEPAHQEVPKQEASVKSFGALKKRHGDWRLSVGRSKKLKERTQENGGSRREMANACRGTTRRAGVARDKGYGRQGQGQNDEVQGIRK